MGGVSGGRELLSGRHSLVTDAKREFNGGENSFIGENENFTGERVMNDQNTYRKRPPLHTKEPHIRILSMCCDDICRKSFKLFYT
jgi:hypothetical protein